MSTTSTQLDLLFAGKPSPVRKPLTGPELGKAGIVQAYMNAPDEIEWIYVEAVLNARPLSRLTSENLRSWCGDPDWQYRNILAGVLAFCRGQKLIVFTGEEMRARRASIHGKVLKVYQRTTTQADAAVVKKIFTTKKEKARAAEARKKLAIKGEGR